MFMKNTSGIKVFQVRMTDKFSDKVGKLAQELCNTSKHQFILDAIQEKMEKEIKKHEQKENQ